MRTKKNIGVIGGIKHPWISVDRTRHYFISALSKYYTITYLEDSCDQKFDNLDLILNFYGKTGWERPESIPCPVLLCVHGATVIGQEFLLQNLPNLTNKDGLIVNCQSDINIINSICNTVKPNLCLLPLPVDKKMFYKINKKTAKNVFDIKSDYLCLGFVCRLLPQKNAHIFLRLVEKIKRKIDKKIKVLIIGNYWIDYPILDYVSSEYPKYLQNLIKDLDLIDEVVSLPSELSNEELMYAYNAMDFLIHPTNSLDENFGYVPIEAMACGTPVIGAAYGGLKDSITPEIGLKFPTWITQNGIRMDSQLALDEIISLVLNPRLYKIKSLNCIKRIGDSYSFNHFSERLKNHIDCLIRNGKLDDTKKVDIHSIEKNEMIDELPPTKSGTKWLQYKETVSNYISQDCPVFNNKCEVYMDVPVVLTKDKKYRRDDPAWPAYFTLNHEESKIIEHCSNVPLKFEDCIYNNFNPDVIQSLIDRGVLVMTKKEINE